LTFIVGQKTLNFVVISARRSRNCGQALRSFTAGSAEESLKMTRVSGYSRNGGGVI
jgi:hypothetical protein